MPERAWRTGGSRSGHADRGATAPTIRHLLGCTVHTGQSGLWTVLRLASRRERM